MTTIGIRELRQNASEYIRRVKAGETVIVTERGKPVAHLVPPKPMSRLEQLIAEGRVREAEEPGGFDDLGPPLDPVPGQPTLTEILMQMRDEERY
jgi:prevent-host-death family protein